MEKIRKLRYSAFGFVLFFFSAPVFGFAFRGTEDRMLRALPALMIVASVFFLAIAFFDQGTASDQTPTPVTVTLP